ncbi:MAG: stage II sporulation protein M [Candidatus Diapherotrites archaeon]
MVWMVLENLPGVGLAKKHSFLMFLEGVLLSTVGIWTVHYIFPAHTSVLAIAFVTIGVAPLINKLLCMETQEEASKPGWAIGFLARHFCIVRVYAWLTIGLVASFSLWYVVLPAETPTYCTGGSSEIECIIPARDSVFAEQEKTFSTITGKATATTGDAAASTGGVGVTECKDPETRSLGGCFGLIFNNNAIVLGLAILLSFIYGAGAIFLIGWNASVIGVFIGKEMLNVHVFAGLARAIGYLPHGIPEIMGYFIGAIAGGVISVEVTKRRFHTKEFWIITKDAAVLVLLAYAVLAFGALIEAWLIVGG